MILTLKGRQNCHGKIVPWEVKSEDERGSSINDYLSASKKKLKYSFAEHWKTLLLRAEGYLCRSRVVGRTSRRIVRCDGIRVFCRREHCAIS